VPYFQRARNVELSIIQSLETNVNADWSGVTIVKGFKNAYVAVLPVVAVYEQDVSMFRQEIGNTTHRKQFGMVIDIFTTSNAQRIDLADYISDKIVQGFVFNTYAHASGDKSQIEASADGRITFISFTENRKVEITDSTDSHDRFRHTISFVAEKL